MIRPKTSKSLLAPARVHLTYWWRHRRRLRLAAPQLFTEWVQHRKLYDRDHRWPAFADKVAVKAFVADRLGSDWVIPTLWHGSRLPDAPDWPMPCVVKARHGCGQTAVVVEQAQWPAVRRRARRWVTARYGYWLDEWAYGLVPRGLLVEPYIGCGEVLPIDYKCFVFGGRVEYVQIHLDRAGKHRWIVFDRQWRRMSPGTGAADPPPPATLDQMIGAAEALAHGHDFLRADFYEVAGQPLFGELTLYPGSGLLAVEPPALDRQMGEQWARARGVSIG